MFEKQHLNRYYSDWHITYVYNTTFYTTFMTGNMWLFTRHLVAYVLKMIIFL